MNATMRTVMVCARYIKALRVDARKNDGSVTDVHAGPLTRRPVVPHARIYRWPLQQEMRGSAGYEQELARPVWPRPDELYAPLFRFWGEPDP